MYLFFFGFSLPIIILRLKHATVCIDVCMLSRVWLFATAWTIIHYSSVHGISQARILGWVAIPSSRGSSWPGNWAWVSCICCIGRRILHHYWQVVLVLLSLVLILLSPTPWMAESPYVRIRWTLLCLQMSGVGVWLILFSDWWVEAFRAAVWFGLSSFVTRFLCPRHGAFLSARIWTNKARKTIADLQLKWMMSKKSLLLWAVVTYKCFFTREEIN